MLPPLSRPGSRPRPCLWYIDLTETSTTFDLPGCRIANAVLGVRYDTGPMVGTAEVLCYGTAVIAEPAP